MSHVSERMSCGTLISTENTMKLPGGTDMCPHSPPCPAPSDPDREAAHTVVSHPEQGWSLLCNGVVIFEDTGELLPDGASIAPHRPTDLAFDRPTRVIPQHGGQAPAALSASGGTKRGA